MAAAALPQIPGPPPSRSQIEAIGVPMLFKRNKEVYGQGEPSESFYRVVDGAVRSCRILADGRRNIGAFYLPGDLFGLDAGAAHGFSAEAVTDARLLVIKRRSLLALAASDGDVARELWNLTERELARALEHAVLLSKTAQERMAGFVLEMAERATGQTIDLPMPRQDIADYLGLTIETVSRTLTSLEQQAAIELPNCHRIVLRDGVALKELNS
ncbi:MAG TPA: helix-turn-helix domain-containing protein [Xanthobacteraceae bacterium]|jgi:CRP-like cAMP-binding protein